MKKTMADLVLISITAAWGSSFILMKNVADTVSPLAFLTLRFGVASLLLLIMFFKERKRYTKDMLLKGMVLGFLVTLSMTLQFVGLKYTTPTNSAFITSLSVVFVPILSSIVLKKAPNMSNIAGIIAAVTGLILITGFIQTKSLNPGDLLTLLCSLAVSVHILYVDKYTKDNDAFLLGIAQCIFVFLFSYIFWFMENPYTFLSVTYSRDLIVAVFITGALCTAYAYTGQVVVQKYTTPSRVAIIFTLEPVFATIYAMFIPDRFGNTHMLSSVELVGALLIIFGALVSETGAVEKFLLKNF